MVSAALPRPTERLIFRHVTDADRDTLRRLNADPRVMRHFPSVMGDLDSDNFLQRIFDHRNRFGFTLWALEDRESGAFVGLCGLLNFQIDAPFAPAVELGYRLSPEFWGRGLASEAAREALRHGFEDLGLGEIVSFTAEVNEPSWRVMERIGMRRDDAGAFDHPEIAAGHRLRRHVLYRMDREMFRTLPPPAPGTAHPVVGSLPPGGVRTNGVQLIGVQSAGEPPEPDAVRPATPLSDPPEPGGGTDARPVEPERTPDASPYDSVKPDPVTRLVRWLLTPGR
ncbi:GNAT family N-acetyltransferase [Phaeovibrio sulfidiphilus]|uniref:GNAT family N-acetyltransferase n=1 Tax=Phaeovibrio sulfidiphilus TaxID=1220600 RepID=A0A8J6YYZ1_9PROT|nr:GNAT family N-acetyltransferase [Phaeovibrio sulfidiphilus]MBE1237118.1 GNAT family N-acetyltransferase [Phaeovibrio sulfidiphilus]